MDKIITAEFENIDLAEAAARNLRTRIDNIQEIIIRTHPEPKETGILPLLSLEAVSSAAAGMGNTTGGQNVPVAPSLLLQGQGPQYSKKAVIEIRISQATEGTIPRAVNCLFSSGGYDVNIQD